MFEIREISPFLRPLKPHTVMPHRPAVNATPALWLNSRSAGQCNSPSDGTGCR